MVSTKKKKKKTEKPKKDQKGSKIKFMKKKKVCFLINFYCVFKLVFLAYLFIYIFLKTYFFKLSLYLSTLRK